MFCSNCGKEVHGNFCSNCGSPADIAASPSAREMEDWSREVVYEKLLRIPEVRSLVDQHARLATKHVSSEEFLAIADKIVPLGVSLGTVASIVRPIFTQLGLKTGKERSASVPRPTGKVIVTALCSLAHHGQILRQVRQLEDGCLLEASLPSDLWSFEGALHVSLRRDGNATRVDAATEIPGQMYDWGKSRRALDELFDNLQAGLA